MKDFLSNLPLFKGLDPDKLAELIKESRREKYGPGEVIVEYGQTGMYLGIILEGSAEAVIEGSGGEKTVLGRIEKGEFFGEMSLMTGEPTGANVISLDKCEVLLIPQELFTAHLVTNPSAVKSMAKKITERLRSREHDEDEKNRLKGAWKKNPDPYGLKLQTPKPMKLLVINCGSSSLKYNYFDTYEPVNDVRGVIECIGRENTRHKIKSDKGKISIDLEKGDHSDAFQSMIEVLTDPENGVIQDLSEIDAVGHRVVHGGDKYSQPVIIKEDVLEVIDQLSHIAPLHNPANAMGIRESMKIFPGAGQVAVFDTAFHYKMPVGSQIYGLPYEYYEDKGIRRYGFHGISHNFVALKAAEHLKKNFANLRMITCHMGNGVSLCAVDHGKSVDTSMGMTPTEGLIMGTRCGDLDPSIILYLQRELGMSPEEVGELIDHQSGLKGISGVSNDFREIEAAASEGNRRALLAQQVFCYRIKKYIGAYAAAMGGLDALIFTAGIGEGSTGVRARVCQGLGYMGIMLDEINNQTASPGPGEAAIISDERSSVKVLVVPTDEERMIARETIRAQGYQDLAEAVKNWDEMPIPIEVSAHHVHLSREDAERLFGPGYELTVRAELSQPGQFASNETVNLIGPKGRADRVRILGPYRKESQVEVSITDEFKLGINAPLRASGHIEGTPGIALEGHDGKIDLDKGVICSLRHIHMAPEDALAYGLRDKDMVRVRVESERPLIFGEVLIRVSPMYKLSMHLDTDEANAAEISTGVRGYLDGIHDRV